MGFDKKFKTNIFPFWRISRVIEIMEGVYVGSLMYSDSIKCTYIFVLKVQKNASFTIELNDQKLNQVLYINRMGSLLAIPV